MGAMTVEPPAGASHIEGFEFFAMVLNLRVNFARSGAVLPASMTVQSGGKTINLIRRNE